MNKPIAGAIYSSSHENPHLPSTQVEVLKIKSTWPDCRDGVEPETVFYAWLTNANERAWTGRHLEGTCPLSQWDEWTFVRSPHD